MKVKEESKKVGLKLNIQKTKTMASGPTTSWEIDGETVETVSDFIFFADGDCSHEIKRHLLLGRKVMTNLDSIFKSRDITWANKGLSSQSCGFSSDHVWMWELNYKESWASKNWCFWTVVLDKTLESPLDCREIILKEISPSNEHPGLISLRMDWLDLLAVQGTLKNLLQHHNSKASIIRHSAFFIVQLSHPYLTTWKTTPLTRQTFAGKVMSLLFGGLQNDCRQWLQPWN